MNKRSSGILIKAAIALLVIALLLLAFGGVQSSESREIAPAPQFSATDHLNRTFSLSDFAGKVVVLHITQLENPLCLECEKDIVGELRELEKLASSSNITIITLNLRKSPASESGWSMAEENYGINVTWYWVEEFEPFGVGDSYLDYWQVDGALANPTVLLLNPGQDIAGAYHVYVVGRGELDGIQTEAALAAKADRIWAGAWGDDMEGSASSSELGIFSMLALGAVTSFSPCSIALLMALVLYIGSMGGGRGGRVGPTMMHGLGIGIAFTLGMSLVFLLIGLLLGYLGGLLSFSAPFYAIAGAALVLLGINSIYPFSRMFRKKEEIELTSCACQQPQGRFGGFGRRLLDRARRISVLLAGFLLGMLFSLGWAPCALSLVFPMILLMFAQGLPMLQSGLLLFVFGLGHGLIIIPLCAASGELKARLTTRFESAANSIKIAFGAAVIVVGILFAARVWGLQLW
ncbi:MAG: sulfite exporter TauE/SafE family protein [Methanomassiliicoccales archaeon]|nr:sulfite exporter TauE/SafE family protein [Methanomassiliicoccales archaeon]